MRQGHNNKKRIFYFKEDKFRTMYKLKNNFLVSRIDSKYNLKDIDRIVITINSCL